MLSQSDALRFEEVFTKFSGKEFSNRIAIEDIEDALGEMKVKLTAEELKSYLAAVDFEARDGLSVDQFISVVRSALSAKEDATDESDVMEAWISLGGSPDKTGCITAAKLSGVFSEFELAVDLGNSLASAADSEGADYQTFKALLK